jgi:hypothetical protein
MSKIIEKKLSDHSESPIIIEATNGQEDLDEFSERNLDVIVEKMLLHGCILFRGFRVNSIIDFERVIDALRVRRMDYVFGSSPRTSIGNRIFTSTEYANTQHIPLHNEHSYHREWPSYLAFACLEPPSVGGGETPIASMRSVGRLIGDELMNMFEERKVKYVRHYREHIDVSWQRVFGTSDRNALSKICTTFDIEEKWLSENLLRTSHIAQGIVMHPLTKERFFFNQAHLFHVSSLGKEGEKSMVKLFGNELIPRNSFFGDGGEIDRVSLNAIRSAFSASEILFPWRRGDVLLIDNIRYAHGRRPYQGQRKIVVALLDKFYSANMAVIPNS